MVQILLVVLLTGCGLFGGRKTSMSTSISMGGQLQEIKPLERPEYEVLGVAEGKASARQWFVLWFPVGAQKNRNTLIEDAYFKAVEEVQSCDAIMLPRTRQRTILIPTLFVNVVNRHITLRGRCIRMLTNNELMAPPTLGEGMGARPPLPTPTPTPEPSEPLPLPK